MSKRCLSPKLKTHALELHAQKVKLKQELKIRSEEENLCVILYHGEFGLKRTTSLQKSFERHLPDGCSDSMMIIPPIDSRYNSCAKSCQPNPSSSLTCKLALRSLVDA
jgi:hypothetical protein